MRMEQIGAPALYANIPIINIKNDMKAEKIKEFEGINFNKKLEEVKQEEAKKEKVEENITEMIDGIKPKTDMNHSANDKTNPQDDDKKEDVQEKDDDMHEEDDDDDVTFDDLLKAAEEEDNKKVMKE